MTKKKNVVYIVKCHDFYKIGITDDVHKRLLGLQTGNPYEITLVRAYDVPLDFEKELHGILKMANAHVRNEWFSLSPAALKIIMEYCQVHEDCFTKAIDGKPVSEG